DLAVEDRREDRAPFELRDDGEEPVDAAAFARDALPLGQEASVRRGWHRLDLPAECGERFAPERGEDFCVAHLAPVAGRSECAFDDRVRADERREDGLDRARREPEAARDLLRLERAVRPRVPTNEVDECRRRRIEERRWNTLWRDDAERVAVARDV